MSTLSERMRVWPEDDRHSRRNSAVIGIRGDTVDAWADEVAALEAVVMAVERTHNYGLARKSCYMCKLLAALPKHLRTQDD